MQTKSIFKFEIINTIFIIILGVILHFSYEWSNNNIIIGFFSAINESVWEHLKLLFFPTLITIIAGNSYLKKEYPDYLSTKCKFLIYSILFIIISHYSYVGIIGYHIPFVDISIFFLSVFLTEFYTIKNINNQKSYNMICSIFLITLSITFIFFTYKPVKINLFKDPVTHTYGIHN